MDNHWNTCQRHVVDGRGHRLIQGRVHESFGLVKCTVGRVNPSNIASWTGIPRPWWTEYKRASTSFRPDIVQIRRAVSRRMLRCRRVSLAKPCATIRATMCRRESMVEAWAVYGTDENKQTGTSRIIIDDWILPSLIEILNESSHFYLCSSINSYNGIRDTNRTGIYYTITSDKRGHICDVFASGNPPFLTRFRSLAISASDWRRFTFL